MRPSRPALIGLMFLVALAGRAEAQRPLGTISAQGETVTPVFEGWYVNDDGSKSISFGYFNRNFEQIIDIPVGTENRLEPGDANQGQPTRFHPRRHWGVFVVHVPADFDGEVTWTLKMQGQTFSIPGTVHRDWQIDALEGEAGSGNTPPRIKLSPDGPEGAGPAGVTADAPGAMVGVPLEITVWAKDDGRTSGSVSNPGEEDQPVHLTWFKHQGPGHATFSETEAEISSEGGAATTQVTFDEPGHYVLRVRANDASGVAGAGHAQCCWTNGFVTVTVTN